MDADRLLRLLGHQAKDPSVERAFVQLRTQRRPQLDPEDPDVTRDWVLVRRKGVELGFVDELFFQHREKWKRRRKDVPLLLCQIYFYTERDDIADFTETLPFGLRWSDSRTEARRKLMAFESSRRSYIKDAWDPAGYRMTLDYKKGGKGIDSIVCQLEPKPWPEKGRVQPALRIADWISFLGLPAASRALRERLRPLNLAERIAEGDDEYEVDFRYECGLELYFIEAKELKLLRRPVVTKRTELVFASVTFLRSRELDARQWTGELPNGLSFDDTQETMREKMGRPPNKVDDDTFSGLSLWNYPAFSVEVTYDNIQNHLLRIAIMAPGF